MDAELSRSATSHAFGASEFLDFDFQSRCPMKKSIGRILRASGCAWLLISSTVLAADTTSDWTGQNNVMPAANPNNNYTVLSPTSVGGQFQGLVNFPVGDQSQMYYLSDPALEGGPL